MGKKYLDSSNPRDWVEYIQRYGRRLDSAKLTEKVLSMGISGSIMVDVEADAGEEEMQHAIAGVLVGLGRKEEVLEVLNWALAQPLQICPDLPEDGEVWLSLSEGEEAEWHVQAILGAARLLNSY